MAEREILVPRKGYRFDLATLLFAIITLIVFTANLAYDLTIRGGGQTPQLLAVVAILLLVTLILSFRPGRFVIIDREHNMVSRPLLVRRETPAMIPLGDISSFAAVRSFSDTQRIVAILVRVAEGRTVKYSEIHTPGSVPKILSILANRGIKEEPRSGGSPSSFRPRR